LRWPSRVEDNARPERGDIVLGWLTRVIIALAVLGIVVFDGLSLAVAHFAAVDDANSAADSASEAWLATHDLSAALQAAQESAAEHGETVRPHSLDVDPDGTAHVQITHEATTLVVRHIPLLRSWTTIIASGSGKAMT
jgi:hypothetical protein